VDPAIDLPGPAPARATARHRAVAAAVAAIACAEPPPCAPLPAGPIPAAPGAVDVDTPPNLLLVIADDVSTAMIRGFPGAVAPVATPTLDALADAGVRFTAAWGAPSCSPARASLLTGRMPRRTGVGTSLNPLASEPGLPLAEQTLAELLRDLPATPYTAAMVGKWHLSGTADGGLDAPGLQGFAPFRGSVGNLNAAHTTGDTPQRYGAWERLVDGVIAPCDCHAVRQTTLDALDLLAELPEPWLLVISFHAAHQPWDPVPISLGGVGEAAVGDERYRDLIRVMDLELGRIRAAMHPDLAARTWTIWAGDNGSPEALAGDGRGKHSLFETGVGVPLILHGPGVVDPGRADATPVHLADIVPTALTLAGVDPIPGLDGVDLGPLLDRSGPLSRGAVVTEQFEPNGLGVRRTRDAVAVRDPRFKLIVSTEAGASLFDLALDPEERTDLFARNRLTPEARRAAIALTAALARHLQPD
jgi:arylsulfatase A-like enzyme